MNQTEARKLLERLMWTIQKARSNVREVVGTDDVAEMVYKDLSPYVLPEYSVMLNAVTKALAKEKIEGQDLYNLFFMAHKEPVLAVGYAVLYTTEMPVPETSWLIDLMGE